MKMKFIILALLLFLSMIGYFYTHSSYQQSLEAKYFYTMGDYEQAYELASQAYTQEPYNRMAMTIVRQSEIALRFLAYIQEAKKYMADINAIANQPTVGREDKLRIKMMCEIIMEKYPKLQGTVLTEESLIEEAKSLFTQFSNLHAKVEKSLKN